MDYRQEFSQTLRLRNRLLSRIHRHYGTITDQVLICGRTYTFTRIADPNGVLDQVCRQEDQRDRAAGRRRPDEELHLPYWAELWDSAIGMARHLLTDATFTSAKNTLSVMDLGCGMGFSGTVAASLGHSVLFADLETPPLLFARFNSAPWAAQVRARRVNWQKDILGEQFDVILGADIVYDRSQWIHLDQFWKKHLAEGGRIILGEPGRKSGDEFIPWAGEKGWQAQVLAENIAAGQKQVRVIALRRG